MQSGGMAYVENAGYAGVIHARLLLSLVAGREWVILTPDHDIDVEDLRPENPDFSLYFSIPDGSIPLGVPAGSVYSFDPMSAKEYSNFMVLGRAERDRELLLRGLLVPVADPVAPVAADADAQEDMWVLAEYLDGHKMGEEVFPDAGCAREDQRCLIHLLDDAGKDHVVLAAGSSGLNWRSFVRRGFVWHVSPSANMEMTRLLQMMSGHFPKPMVPMVSEVASSAIL